MSIQSQAEELGLLIEETQSLFIKGKSLLVFLNLDSHFMQCLLNQMPNNSFKKTSRPKYNRK
jgi:hypothetical protein